MVSTEGNTNRECSFFGMGWRGLWVCGMAGFVEWKWTKRRVAEMWGRASRHRRRHIVDNSMQAKAQPEAQLGAREAKAMSLGGSVVAIAQYSHYSPLLIAKGRFFCNQILHIPFITNILARFFASKNFKEKSFQNQPLIPWKIANYNIFNCKRTVPLV